MIFVPIETLITKVRAQLSSTRSGSVDSLLAELSQDGQEVSRRHLVRVLDEVFGEKAVSDLSELRDADGHAVLGLLTEPVVEHATKHAQRLLIVTLITVSERTLILAKDRRGARWWVSLDAGIEQALGALRELVGSDLMVVARGELTRLLDSRSAVPGVLVADFLYPLAPYEPPEAESVEWGTDHSHLVELERESIRIIREAVAVAKNPAMLFSMGKDSMVMWTLAKKAFWPEPPPFPLVLIDSRWNFSDMYRFQAYLEAQPETTMVVHTNPEAITRNINPFDHGSATHTDITLTQALRQALDIHRFDFVFGGGRRDEERSRAKERVFSLRNERHGWDPKAQRPELWNVYNTTIQRGQSMRVFPLSNWTELDIWRYIQKENVPVVPLYFSKVRPFVERDGSLILVDDERFPLQPGERVHIEPVRFRTLGCYPLTGGVRSGAKTVGDIITELEQSRVSERSTRVIDFDPGASMELKKREGYF